MDSSNSPNQPVVRFAWHPTYQGQDVEHVRRGLADEIGRDQRQYALSLEGAEQAEFASLTSVVELERRWGQFDFGWTDVPAGELADRIVAFELERESRQDLISFADYRADLDESGEEMTPELAWKTKPVLITAALGILALIIILWLAL
ncbi:MAG: hypothetical protein WKF81_13535 [Thermomicrobiales bacterium]